MAILDFLKSPFVDVIDWTEEPGQLTIRYPFHGREVKNGAQLTVREGQRAVFIDEGQMGDMFGPGLHTLDTGTLPLLTAIQNWDKGFQSPFKSDIYFFTQKEQINQKWGTAQPVTIRDKELGPLRIRAFGSYSFKIAEISAFASTLMGTLEELTVDDIEPQLRGAIATALATGLGGGSTPFLDLAASQTALSEALKTAVTPAFTQWGLEVRSFFVESLSLPEEVQKHLDKSSSMRVLGDLDRYAKFQAAESIETAAANTGGLAGLGAGMAAGAAIGQTMSAGLGGTSAAGLGGGAAPGADPFEQVEKLHKLLTIGAIDQAEFDTKKAELLGRIR